MAVADTDLVAVFVLLWVASIVRVGAAFVRHELFGTEASLAALAVVLVPLVLVSSKR